VRTASIGPFTSAALGEFGIHPTVEAEDHTVDGLIEVIVSHEAEASA